MRSSSSGPLEDLGDWPCEGLEPVESCPVCSCFRRVRLHEDLSDTTFGVAPGKWTLWQCAQCNSAFIDPRPTRSTIHRAYSSYYTHVGSKAWDKYEELSYARKLRRRLVNGYTNWRFGTKLTPASMIGIVVALTIPGLKKAVDRKYRHLPKPSTDGSSLLDVGCGDGAFLKLARQCGWNVVGIDIDLKAVSVAREEGLSVFQGGIEVLAGDSQRFEVITLNHVIEHVHEPLEVLRTCYELLEPGGAIWIETPNVGSFGHGRFGHSWRGLEVPRHLVLFNYQSIRFALNAAGFSTIKMLRRPSGCLGMFSQSLDIENGRLPGTGGAPHPISLRAATTLARIVGRIVPTRREFITVKATKGQ